MSDSKSLALIVLIVTLYALYLHANGRLVPLWRYTTNTAPPAQQGTTFQPIPYQGTLIDKLVQIGINGIGAATVTAPTNTTP